MFGHLQVKSAYSFQQSTILLKDLVVDAKKKNIQALTLVDKYLDDAYLYQLTKVTIIHGRGNGALKDAVHSHLKRLKYVKSYRVGGFGEGDHGVTIVEFK